MGLAGVIQPDAVAVAPGAGGRVGFGVAGTLATPLTLQGGRDRSGPIRDTALQGRPRGVLPGGEDGTQDNDCRCNDVRWSEKMGKAKRASGPREGVASTPSLKIHVEEEVPSSKAHAPHKRNGRSLSPYEELIRSLSDRLVEAQRPIRILDAIKWDDEIERAFFAAGCRALPPVSREYYLSRPLPFDPEQKRLEFLSLERAIRRRLGKYNAAGQIMTRMCMEYRQVVDLLTSRGTPAFAALSERLYGGSADCFHAGDPTLADLGRMLSGSLDNLPCDPLLAPDEPK